jgi:hypothetical protein
MSAKDLDDLKYQGLELFAEVEGEELEVEEDFTFYVYKKDGELVTGSYVFGREQWTVAAKNEEDAIETVRKEIKNGDKL